jgi:F420-dependent oxidoreductase-like protein
MAISDRAVLDLHLSSFTYPGPEAQLFPTVLRIAGAAERAGFRSVSVMDHLHQIPPQGAADEPMLEAYTTLGAIAAHTSNVRLLTIVTDVMLRQPSLLAKQVTTLDVISGGRAMLGIGAGGIEDEHHANGIAFPPIGERLRRVEEAVRICRAMFDGRQSNVEGRYYRTRSAYNLPRPLQTHLPILIGGGGEQRTLRMVAQYADLWNVIVYDPETARHKREVLQRHCAAIGRDPASIVKTLYLGVMVVDSSEQRVGRRLKAIEAAPPPALRGVPAKELGRRLISGTPERVAERLRAFIDAGFDGVSFTVRDAYELDLVALAGQAGKLALS